MMGICLVLFVSAWAVVRLWSMPVAIGMCVVAMIIPPVAAMVANRRGPEDRWWDDPPDAYDKIRPMEEPPDDPESDELWEELDGKKRRR